MTEGRATTLTLDALGRPLCITRPDGATVHNEYDPLGNVCRQCDAEGHVTRLKYGGTGVLLSLTEPSVCGRWAHTWRFIYDTDERLRRIINPNCERYIIEYDAVDRIVREDPFDGRASFYRSAPCRTLRGRGSCV